MYRLDLNKYKRAILCVTKSIANKRTHNSYSHLLVRRYNYQSLHARWDAIICIVKNANHMSETTIFGKLKPFLKLHVGFPKP